MHKQIAPDDRYESLNLERSAHSVHRVKCNWKSSELYFDWVLICLVESM